jgi:hypothetical protein
MRRTRHAAEETIVVRATPQKPVTWNRWLSAK